MRVVVVGAGIIGVCTAHALRRAGLDVTVLERRSGVAQETSFANAGVLAPGYVGPWAAPGMPRKVLSYLLRPESPVVFRPSLSPALWRWIRRWLGECDPGRYRRNRTRMQRLAFYSQEELRTLRAQPRARIRAGDRLPAAIPHRQGSGGCGNHARDAHRTRRSPRTSRCGAVPRARAGVAPRHRAGRRLASAGRRNRQLRVLRASAEGHRHSRRSGVPFQRRRAGRRDGARPRGITANVGRANPGAMSTSWPAASTACACWNRSAFACR